MTAVRPRAAPGNATASLQTVYDELLRSTALDHDPWSRPNLHTFRPRHEVLWRALDRYLAPPRTTIADVACHNGFFLRLSHELGFTRFVAVDYFPLSEERSFLTGLDGVTFLRENFNRDGFLSQLASGSVDAVVSTEVLEHLYHHPAGYLSELWRVLRAGGLLLLSTPNPGTLAKAMRSLRGIPVTWGDLEFARTPKVVADTGEPLAVWDIHFREYQPRDVLALLGELPGARVLESSFLVNAASPGAAPTARIVKSLLWSLGLGHVRVLSATQYHVVRKQA